jgi:archaellum component FlaC
MTPYQIWQVDKYGNILEEGETHHMVDQDNDREQVIEDQLRRVEEMAELQLLEQR